MFALQNKGDKRHSKPYYKGFSILNKQLKPLCHKPK
jgi:hypothetical protein